MTVGTGCNLSLRCQKVYFLAPVILTGQSYALWGYRPCQSRVTVGNVGLRQQGFALTA
ncbi:MAG: hypothetical protein R3Y62_05340 [Eubacteriales bacterium]